MSVDLITNRQLRNHIPIGGPATREPCTGNEPILRLSLGFTPGWLRKHVETDFSEVWHTDPDYRYETLLNIKRYLNKLFPEIDTFKMVMQGKTEVTCATLSGVFGIRLMPMIYGMDVVYKKDDWPDAASGQVIPKHMLSELKQFDLYSNPAIRQLLEQMDHIEKRYGQIHGYLNYQGILNVALKLRGNDIFTDMYDDPQFVHHLFNHIAETIKETSKLIQARQRKSGFNINLLSMSNCVMNMISPDLYEEFVMPYDLMLSFEYERFGIHTCNWNITPYIDVLHKIPGLGYIDMGMVSDLKRVKDTFQDARRAVFYSLDGLFSKSRYDIINDIKRIRQELVPCDIILADIPANTPILNIREFIDIIKQLGGV